MRDSCVCGVGPKTACFEESIGLLKIGQLSFRLCGELTYRGQANFLDIFNFDFGEIGRKVVL